MRIAFDQLTSGIDGHHPIDDTKQCMHDVFDPHDRDARRADLLDRLDQFEDLGLGEATRDLVEQQEPRLRGQRPGELETLAVEQRQRAGHDVGFVEHPRLVEREDCCFVASALQTSRRSERRTDQDIFEHRQALEGPRNLGRSGYSPVASHVRGELGEVVAGEADRAAVGSQIPGDEIQQSGLSRAVGADDAEGFALGNDEREVLHHLERAEALPQIDDFE